MVEALLFTVGPLLAPSRSKRYIGMVFLVRETLGRNIRTKAVINLYFEMSR
jgi:hypothetical protein